MEQKRVGDFTIKVTDPYPCWVGLIYNLNGRETEIRFSHKELSDLKYAVDYAIREARLKLGKDRDEI